jgi:hypothetical protein
MINDERYKAATKKEDYIFDFEIDKIRFTINASKNQIWINKGTYNSWSSPGSDFIEFLTRLNKEYFIDKVFPNQEKFDKKATLASFRKKLNEICPSYKSPEFIKSIRFEIRMADWQMTDEESFVNAIHSIDVKFKYELYHELSTKKHTDFDFDEYKWCFSEPWQFIVKKNSGFVENVWKAFSKLQLKLKQEFIVKKSA